jgi:hypothetical protein
MEGGEDIFEFDSNIPAHNVFLSEEEIKRIRQHILAKVTGVFVKMEPKNSTTKSIKINTCVVQPFHSMAPTSPTPGSSFSSTSTSQIQPQPHKDREGNVVKLKLKII